MQDTLLQELKRRIKQIKMVFGNGDIEVHRMAIKNFEILFDVR
jgi:predicted phosphodiesterase